MSSVLDGGKRAATNETGQNRKPTKRCKRPQLTGGCSFGDMDALGIVMEFLAPKELYNLAFSSNLLLEKLTTRMVVRSAMISGGHARTTMNELYPLMKAGSIHSPSPARLLRLVNGKKCEACHREKVNHVRPGYGVFICWDCTTKRFTKAVKTSWVRVARSARYQDILENQKRVVAHGQNNYTWKLRLKKKDGEECGPLVTFDDIERMARESTLSVEQMLNHLPPMDEYMEFVRAYDDYTELAKIAEKKRYEKKKKATKVASDNRQQKSRQIVAKVEKLLDEDWRDFALRNTQTNQTGKQPCLRFSSGLSNALLKQYVTSPSKAKKAIIQEVADNINHSFRLLKESPLCNFDFLTEDDGFQSALKSHCIARFPDFQTLTLNSYANEHFFHLISERKYLEATDRLLDCNFSGPVWGFGIVLIAPEAALSALAWERRRTGRSRFHVMRDMPSEASDAELACTVWAHEQRQLKCASNLYDDAILSKLFQFSGESFVKCKEAIREFGKYIMKNRTNLPEMFLQYALPVLHHSGELIPHLLSKDFKKLEDKMDCGFWNWYG